MIHSSKNMMITAPKKNHGKPFYVFFKTLKCPVSTWFCRASWPLLKSYRDLEQSTVQHVEPELRLGSVQLDYSKKDDLTLFDRLREMKRG